ncbi:MAG TPA: 50S ribosomal protein L4 [Erysipelotrichaceae bacterium]|nr:50S ribosomal protein L4 [Erysipelotrichaceae bacterium]
MAKNKTVSVKVYNMAGEEISKMSLNAEVFDIEPHRQVMFDSVQVAQANSRQATAKTKVRHEVRGGGKKPFRQKGTGRARAGSSRSPIWVGGGTMFGPIGNQNPKISQNKKEHKLALKSALSLKTKDGLVVVDEIKFDERKTKNFVSFLDAFKVNGKALVVVDEITEEIFASARNIGFAKVVTPDNVSVLDLLNVDNLIVSKTSIKAIEEALM